MPLEFIYAILISIGITITSLVITWAVAWFIGRKILLPLIQKIVKKTRYDWDDVLLDHKVFDKLVHVIPALALYALFFYGSSFFIAFKSLGISLSVIYLIFSILFAIDAFLNAVMTLYSRMKFANDMPIKGFVQVIKIILWIVAVILTLSVIMQQSPTYFLTGLGAMTAVIILVFKDFILGLVAGIQLSTNDMVRVGDWVEMPKFGADGDVIDISLATVKIQNWDKTIVTIPTYSMVADSFKNWRGMSNSGGRRIKRCINIDMSSVKFCDAAMLERFASFRHISEYIQKKKVELDKFNADNDIDDSVLVNGRRMTNLGTFRAYLEGYLHHHPKINMDMTFLVRHMQPSEKGLPIEIYVFCSDKVWANYEAIQADIFDHILAVIPEFDLRIFQHPTGADLTKLTGLINTK